MPEIIKRKLTTLKKLPDNPRQISKESLAILQESLATNPELFDARPIVLSDRTGELMIIAGNMRYEAAKKIGLKEVPTIVLPGLTEEKERELAIRDNINNGEWDWDMLANGWDDLPLADWGLEIPGFNEEENNAESKEEDEEKLADTINKGAELQKKWKTKSGQLWKLGEHRLLCGDSTKAEEVERLMDGSKADCIFTSPPYAVGIDYGETYEDTIDNLRLMLKIFAESWKSILVEGGYAVTNFGDVQSGRKILNTDGPCEYPMALEYFPVFRDAGWCLWSRRVWCKPGAACGSSRHCIGTNRAACNYEHVWTWKLTGPSIVDNQITGKWPSQAGWFDTTHDNKLDVGLSVHGAGMPVAVAARSITWHSRINQIVHEPFSGTGTTLIAAEQLGRKCYGMEISPQYCAVILQRWADYTGKAPGLIDG
jgi:DNA modification methylase